jgi:outer membrane protein assembly factor BamE (lipoprotein component of BamABCDE complex)
MTHRVLQLLPMLATMCVGCTTITHTTRGTPIHPDALQSFEPGETSVEDVLQRVGVPEHIVRRRAGDLFIYEYVVINTQEMRFVEPILTRLPFFDYRQSYNKRDTLFVAFDKQGRVKAFGYSQSTPP